MLTRFLGGAVACASAAGALSAQSPIVIPLPPTTGSTSLFADVGSPLNTAPGRLPTQPGAQPSGLLGFPGTAISTTAQTPAKPATPAPAAKPAAPATPAPHTPNTHLLANGGCGAVACPPAACNLCCDPCGPPGRVWLDAGYWYGTITGQNVPPLVTAAPAGSPRTQAGALGQPGTTVLYPTGRVNDNWRSGFYLNAGVWLDDCQKCGIEGNFFFLGTSRERFVAGSPGVNIISRPFFNTALNIPDTELVSFPGILAGSVTVDARSSFIGGGPNMIKNICCGPCGRFDLLLGYLYLNLEDEINIREDLTSLPGQTNVPPGTRFIVRDNFRTSNSFHGVNIGVATERRYSHWYFGARAGVALGNVHQQVDIDGSTTITPPGQEPRTLPGGLLTQSSNIGRYERDRFAAIPWFGVKLGLQVTPRIRTYVGYDFMYFSNVARAGDQIDLRVNPTLIPSQTGMPSGAAFPVFTPRETGAAVNAIRFGVEARY
jgi:hypothetical protein